MNEISGKLPENWAWATLDDIGVVSSGGTPSTKDEDNFGGEISWLTPADLTNYREKYITRGKRNISEKGLRTSSAVLLSKGTILFSSRAPIGYVVIAANPIATNQGFKNLTVYDPVFNEYVYYYLMGSKSVAKSHASGTTFLEISGRRFARLPIPIAPVNEQHRIIAKIEELFSRLAAGVETLKQVQLQLRQYRQSVLKAAVEGRLTAQWREEHKGELEPASELLQRILAERREKWESEQLAKYEAKGQKPPSNWREKYKEPAQFETSIMSEIPEKWVWTSMGSILSEPLRNGHSARAATDQKGIRALTLTAVTYGDFSEKNTKITQADPNRVKDLWLEPNDILIERSNTPELVGTARLYCGPKNFAIYPDLLIRARIMRGISDRYIVAVLQSEHVKQYFRRSAQGISGSMPKIDQSIIEKTAIPLPSRDEQNKIADELDREFSLIENLELALESSFIQAENLRFVTLKRAFEGKLVPQDPEDEPAEKLLERIKAEKTKRESDQQPRRKRQPNTLQLTLGYKGEL